VSDWYWKLTDEIGKDTLPMVSKYVMVRGLKV